MEEIGFPDRHHVNAAEGWLELGDSAEAARELRRVSAAALGHADVLDLRWRLHAARRQWDSALDVARLVTAAAPDRAAGWIHQSYTLHELKRTEEAMRLLLPLAEQFPDEAIIAYNLACYACQLGDLTRAKLWLARAARQRGKLPLKEMALEDPDLAPLREYLATL